MFSVRSFSLSVLCSEKDCGILFAYFSAERHFLFNICIDLLLMFMCKKVLIAEDYEDTRSLMRFLLEGYGYEVLEAATGQQAIETVKKERPDLILMDISMPGVDGLTATQIIRKSTNGANLPIIAVTAYGDSYYKKAIEAGCDDLINKPLDFDNLEPVIKQYLANE